MDIKTRRQVAKQLLQAAAKLEAGPSTADQIDGLKKMVEGLDKAYQDFLKLNDGDTVPNLNFDGAQRNLAGLTKAIENTAVLLGKKLKVETEDAKKAEAAAALPGPPRFNHW